MTSPLVVCGLYILLCCTTALRPTMVTQQIRGLSGVRVSVRYRDVTLSMMAPTPPSRYNARQPQPTTTSSLTVLEKADDIQTEVPTTSNVSSAVYKSLGIATICILFFFGWSADVPSAKKELLLLGSKSMLFTSTISSTLLRYGKKILAAAKTATMRTWSWYYLSIPFTVGLMGVAYLTKWRSPSTSSISTSLPPSPTTRAPRTTLSASGGNNNNNFRNNPGVGVINTNTVDRAYTVISSPLSNNNSSITKPYTIISSPPTIISDKTPTTVNGRNPQKPFDVDIPQNTKITPAPTHTGTRDTRARNSISAIPPRIVSNVGSNTDTPANSIAKTAPVTPIGVKAADVLLNDLIDIKRVFEKIDSELIADLIAPNLYKVVDKVMVKDVRAVRTAKGIPAVPVVYEVVLRARTQVLVRKVIDRVKEDPSQFIDFKSLIASEVAVHDQLIRSIVSRSRRFVVVSCSMIATVASLIQLFVWLGRDPRLSMGVLGLGIVMEIVFLDQQEQVMIEFAQLLTAKLLSPQKLWRELTHGTKHAALVAVIAQELRAEFNFLFRGNYREFANELRDALPDAATPSYRHLETVLNVKGYLRTALRRIGDSAAMFYGI